MDYGLLIFLVFLSISVIVIARAVARNKKKKDTPKRRYKPYQPVTQTQTPRSSPPNDRSAYTTSPNSDSRAAYASADEYFRAGMFDRAKEEYLKTGRVFGAAKSVAAKGREFVTDSIQIISRYAPEREEEMVRNLSRYFYDSGETEISAYILYEKGLEEEADAVLATIGKSVEDIAPLGVVEVAAIDQSLELEEEKTLEELEEIAAETIEQQEKTVEKKEEVKPVVIKEKVSKLPKKQRLKSATAELDDRCSVCMSPIKAGESFVRCPFCEIPSHYAHIVEWIKVKPQCPNCRKKLVARMFQQD
ncbi:MAG: E3 ubiquitin protein ligase [Candidatus Heimdallarchaeota archaeon]|nr:E3 ubiquitin protein ligase [Candidatus Heimdallarchaeota archaeon]